MTTNIKTKDYNIFRLKNRAKLKAGRLDTYTNELANKKCRNHVGP